MAIHPQLADQTASALPPPPSSKKEDDAPQTTTNVYREELSEYDWRSKFRTDMVSQVEKWADALGVSKFALDSLVRDNMDGALSYITRNVIMPNRQSATRIDYGEGVLQQVDTGSWQPETSQDWQQIWNAGLLYYSALAGVDLAGINQASRGSRGSGRRGPTAAELRNMFDEDQLTDAVQSMWGAYLLEETPEARAIAKQYIEAIVSTGGEKEIDFETFVKGRIRKTARHKLIYQNKPEHLDELQYIGPYAQMAGQVLGGASGNQQIVGDLAAGAAALGASQEAFAGRLQRTDQFTGTKGFIGGLEERVRNVRNVLRG